MRLRLIQAPATEPLTTDEARLQVSETDTAHDAALDAWIATAREHLDGPDGVLGRALITQTWELLLDRFPAGREIPLPLPPLQSVVSIKYLDAAGDEQTLARSVYGVDPSTQPGVVHLKRGQAWPATFDERNAVVIRFVAGYGDNAEAVPQRLRSAMKLHIGDLFANREAQGEQLFANAAYDNLIFPFRMLTL